MDYAQNFRQSVTPITKVIANSVLEEYRSLYRWQNICDNENRIALDIGFGDGTITMELIKPFLPAFTRLNGADKSEDMIRFAKYSYKGEGCQFFFLDVEKEILDKSLLNCYDHVFSFSVLHYVNNLRYFKYLGKDRIFFYLEGITFDESSVSLVKRYFLGVSRSLFEMDKIGQALQNMYDVLKPNGNLILAFMPKFPFYVALKILSLNPNWSTYMQDFDSMCPRPLAEEKFPHKVFAELMSQCGFKNVVTKFDVKCGLLDSWEKLEGQARYVDPFQKQIPPELQDEYFTAYIEGLKQIKGFWAEKFNDDGEFEGVVESFEVLSAYGEKGS